MTLAASNGTDNKRKQPLFEIALASKDVATFKKSASEAGHTTASFSANVDWDWYYQACQRYLNDHVGAEDDGSTYVVLAAVGQYIGLTAEETDTYLAERREAMGAGAADRLAKAREKAQQESKRKDTIIAALMAKLGMTEEDLAALA